MKILLITDIHYGANTNYPHFKGEDYINVYGEEFENLIQRLHSKMKKCDLVINLGDFIHDENAEKDIDAYKKAMKLITNGTPVKHVLGNHDIRNITRENWCQLVGEQKSYYSFNMGEYHHVVLDGNRNRLDPNSILLIDDEQLKWLANDIANTNLLVIVYDHFPLYNQNLEDNIYFKDIPERAIVSNWREIQEVFEKSKKVLAVFSGHTHFFGEEIINGIHYLTVPSFTENDGTHKPQAKYAIASLSREKVNIEIKKIDF